MTNFLRDRVFVPAAAVVAALSLAACGGPSSEPEQSGNTYRDPDLTRRTELLAEAFSDAAINPSDNCRYSMFRESPVSQSETLTLANGARIIKESTLRADGNVDKKVLFFGENEEPRAKMTPHGAHLVDAEGEDVIWKEFNKDGSVLYETSDEDVDQVQKAISAQIQIC